MSEPTKRAMVYLRLTEDEFETVVAGLEHYANDLTVLGNNAYMCAALAERFRTNQKAWTMYEDVDAQLQMPFVVAGADFAKGSDKTVYTLHENNDKFVTPYIDERDKPLALLIKEYDILSEKIAGNDGRLSAGSSSQLDYEMDMQEDIAAEIMRRLNLKRAVRAIVQKDALEARMSAKHNWLVRALLRIGIVSKNQEGYITWPFHVYDATYNEVVLSRQSWFEVIKSHSNVGARWLVNRWLPFRWGIRFGPVVFGDIGNSQNGIDRLRVSWFKYKPAPTVKEIMEDSE